MFILKDLRKIPTILDEAVDCNVYDANCSNSDDDDDENDDRGNRSNPNPKTKSKRTKREEPIKILKLGRRKQEFEGSVRVLCQPSHAPKLHHLEVLNLYECEIHDLSGFGTMFQTAAPNLETLNLGRNALVGIPDDFAKVRSLKHLWLDDCKIAGALPSALLHLPNIESLRLPNNQITHLPIGGIDKNLLRNRNRNRNRDNNRDNNDNDEDDGEEFEFDDLPETQKVIPLLHLKILCLDRNKLGGKHEEKPEIPKASDTTEIETEIEGGEAVVRMDEDDVNVDIDIDADAERDTDMAIDPTEDEDSSEAKGPTFLPSNLAEWAPNLEECFLRHNGFSELGVKQWPKTLKILQISSNRLTHLEEIMGDGDGDGECDGDGDGKNPALTHLYANGNQLEALPEGILKHHPNLKRLVVSHNIPLCDLPTEVWQTLEDKRNKDKRNKEKGKSNDEDNGNDKDKDKETDGCQILWKPNPNLTAPWGEDEEIVVRNPKHQVC